MYTYKKTLSNFIFPGVLQLVCTSDSILSISAKPLPIVPITMKGILKDIPDEVIDLSHSLIMKVKMYFTSEAYQLLTSKGMYIC